MYHNKTDLRIKQLEAERAQALLNLERLRETLRSEVDPEFDEADPDLVEQEKALALVESWERKLASIEHALEQAQKGVYGRCEHCGEAIDPARLEAVPETTLCLKCKVIDERRIRMSAIPVKI